MKTLILFLVDILLGYVPQAAGCAICLFAVTNQNLRSRKFWLTTGIFSAIAIVIRTAYNINLIDFGFHTIIIWSIFILVAIGYNKIPAMRSICSILMSGIFITATELITAGSMILIFGSENFTKMMNDTETMDGRIVKAICGIPANILFVIVVLVFYFIKAVLKRRKLQKEAQTIPENL
jgi:lysylphosphatidylglycerol synthetase-like protein (DUF2156 family)